MFDLTIDFPGIATRIAVRRGALQESGQLLRSLLPDVAKSQVMLVTDHAVGGLYGCAVLDAFRNEHPVR